ncbi:SMODS domain-containing nucleotidyltransferase [Kordia sp.]|uniref:SMODS domain-containing nucleotidyltransferase n=1 Tax=Kordia sp. TaxID=1965332 RepID=UPI003B5AE6A1
MQQFKKQDESPQQRIDIKALLIFLFVVAIIGAVLYKFIKYLYYTFTGKRVLNEEDLIKYLESVLDYYEPDDVFDKVLEKGKLIKEALSKKFWYAILGKVRYQGSFDHGTSLNGYSDLDILIQFKTDSYKNEKDMYYTVYNYLKDKYSNSNVIVRKQRVSIGLMYNINGKKEKIDIVPARRTDYVKGKNEYYLHENYKLSKNNEKLKIYPHIQRDFGEYPYEIIKIITLLKLLVKTQKQELPLKSILINEFVKKAFQELKMPNKLNLQIIKVIEFIQSNIIKAKIYAPDNRNNCLTDMLTYPQKKQVKVVLNDILNDLKEDKNNWIEYFPKE